MPGQRDGEPSEEAHTAGRYAVERQVLYGHPPHERNYWVVWAIWDRSVRAFLAAVFAAREEAERHAARLRAEEGPGG